MRRTDIRGLRRARLVAGLLLGASLLSSHAQDRFASERQHMMREIEDTQRQVSRETGQATLDPRVLAAMGTVARHQFVRKDLESEAYENRPLPIGHGQTISQPYIVAIMTDLLRTRPGDRVLELGTGSGYQAAVLAELAKEVYTIEIIEPLAKQAAQRLAELGFRNVEVKLADGYYGWSEHAPFDAIIVTAAASHIPVPLVQQLKPGGRMVIPVGTNFLTKLSHADREAGGRLGDHAANSSGCVRAAYGAALPGRYASGPASTESGLAAAPVSSIFLVDVIHASPAVASGALADVGRCAGL